MTRISTTLTVVLSLVLSNIFLYAQAKKPTSTTTRQTQTPAKKPATTTTQSRQSTTPQRQARPNRPTPPVPPSITELKGGTGMYTLFKIDVPYFTFDFDVPVILKDNQAYITPQPKTDKVTSFFISGNDVYLAGSSRTENASQNYATFWKNGQPQVLDTVASLAYHVCVHNDDVYTVGTRGLYNAKRTVIWKNGTLFDTITEPGQSWIPCTMTVTDEGITITRTTFKNHNHVISQWKNGEETIFEYPDPITNKQYTSFVYILRHLIHHNDIYCITRTTETGKQPGRLYKNAEAIASAVFDPFQIEKGSKVGFALNEESMQLRTTQNRYYAIQPETGVMYHLVGNSIWKNDTRLFNLESVENPETLERISHFVYEIVPTEDDVFVIGSRDDYTANQKEYKPVYVIWKNGKIYSTLEHDIFERFTYTEDVGCEAHVLSRYIP